jgi:hypothetical protein
VGTETEYLPVSIVSMTELRDDFDLTLTQTSGDHVNLIGGCFDAARSVNRYWSFSTYQSWPRFARLSVAISYPAAALDPGTTPGNLGGLLFANGGLSGLAATAIGPNVVRLDDLLAFGDIAIAEPLRPRITIVSQPSNTGVPFGQDLDLYVDATAADPVSYQWRWNGRPLGDFWNFSGTGTNHLHVTDLYNNFWMGTYDVIVSTNCNSVRSEPAIVSRVCDVPSGITVQPADVTVPLGAPATFSVTAQLCHGGNYSWYRNGQPVSYGSSTYTIPSVNVGHTGYYHCLIADALGTTSTRVATLNLAAPVLTGYSITNGYHVSMDFTAPVTATLEYGNTPLLGQTSPLGGPAAHVEFDGPQIGAPVTYFRVRARAENGREILVGCCADPGGNPLAGRLTFPSGRPVFTVTAARAQPLPWTSGSPSLALTVAITDAYASPSWASQYVLKVEDMKLGNALPRLQPADPVLAVPFTTTAPSSTTYYFTTSEVGLVPNTKFWLTVKLRWYESSAPDAPSYPLQFSIPFTGL